MNNILSNFEQSLDKIYEKNKNIEEQYVLLKNKVNAKKLEINNIEMNLNMESLKIIDKEELLKNLTYEKEIKIEKKNIEELEKSIAKMKERIEKENIALDKLKQEFIKREESLNKKYSRLIDNKSKVINELREYHIQWNEWLDENIKAINIEELKDEIKKEKEIIEKIFKEKSILLSEKSKIQKILLEIQKEIIKTVEDKNIYILKKEKIMDKKKDEYKELKKIEEEKRLPESIDNKDDKQLKELIYENEKNVKKPISEYQYVKNLISISNIFWRTNKIIKILDKYFKESIDKLKLKKEFETIKKNIEEIIKFIDIKRFNGIIRIKYKLSEEELNKIEIISNYWNQNKTKFLSYNLLLNNMYEYLFNKVRIVVKTNSVEINEEDKLLINCKKKNDLEEQLTIDKKNIYESYDLEWSAINMLNGSLNDNVDDFEITEKKNLNEVVKLLQSGFSISLLNIGNMVDKNNLVTGNNWNKGMIQYIIDYIQGLDGKIKIKEVWELYNEKLDLENGIMKNKIKIIKDSKVLKTLFDKYIEEQENNDLEIEDYFKNRQNSFLFVHFECKFKDEKSNLVILDFPELYTPEQIFKEYFKDDISLINLMYSNDVKYVKKYNKTEEKPEIILKKLRNSYYVCEVVNHLKYYFKKLNTDTRLQVKYNKTLDDYSPNNFFINPYLEYKNQIDDENNCLILPLMNYINEMITRTNKYILLSVINDNNCKEAKFTIDFINSIS